MQNFVKFKTDPKVKPKLSHVPWGKRKLTQELIVIRGGNPHKLVKILVLQDHKSKLILEWTTVV